MLAIGRALMTNPRLLILDEATEGLAPVIRQENWTAIRDVKGRGQAILIVDKNLKELLPLGEACVILEQGVDRKSAVWGKSVSERVDLGGRRIIKQKRNIQ